MAAWASAQAGRTIRKEDLLRALEREIGESAAVRRLVEGPLRMTARRFFEEVLELEPFRRSSEAVSRGNIKVYAEIGAELARLCLKLAGRDSGTENFPDSLKPGPPPDGQYLLRRAFRHYLDASSLPAGRDRSQLLFLANILIGFHEQTRLQPEIEASLAGSVLDATEVKEALIRRFLPGGWLAGLIQRVRVSRLADVVVPLLIPLARRVITARMMVLELPGGTVRLGEDLTGGFPEVLRHIDQPEALTLLQQVDRTADSLAGTAARDWASFDDRMHFIADLFRSHHLDSRMFDWTDGPGAPVRAYATGH
jgi:hypothetical protein